MRRILLAIITILLIVGGIGFATRPMPSDKLPPLQTGDLIFQTYLSSQTLPIILATNSIITHVGIIKVTAEGEYRVIDSAGVVGESSLEDWVDQGALNQYIILRHPKLHKKINQKHLIETVQTYYGARYDSVFSFKNDTLYCSELPYLSFQALDINLGKRQTIGELNIHNFFVERLIKQRWQQHPSCINQNMDYATCREKILTQELVSPASIVEDKQLQLVYSSFIFTLLEE